MICLWKSMEYHFKGANGSQTFAIPAWAPEKETMVNTEHAKVC
jgi:hypothetical protein